MFTPRLIIVTASNPDEAERIATAVLDARLAVCVNMLPEVESRYWWRGNLESALEVILLIKSSAEQFDALATLVRGLHSYECPELMAFSPQEILPAYLAWWQSGGDSARPWLPNAD